MPSTSRVDEGSSAPIGDVSVADGDEGSVPSTSCAGEDLSAPIGKGESGRALYGDSVVKIHGLIMPSPGDEAGGSENVPRRGISGGESRVPSVGRMPPKSGQGASQVEIELSRTTDLSAH